MKIYKEILNSSRPTKPVILGFGGYRLTDDEKYFFELHNPIGFIIFERNIKDKEQVRELTKSLSEIVEREPLILIDQEGGRVSRLNSNDWQKYPPACHFADMANDDPESAKEALYQNYLKIGNDLREIGINVNCAPVLDLSFPTTHDVIGERAFGSDPNRVIELARVVCNALLDSFVCPVIKHIPGHGRATADSHLELPVVNASRKELEEKDFVPFKNFTDIKLAMTAHILYSDIDSDLVATFSPKIINMIRDEFGFKNLIMTDDLSMKALTGSFAERTRASLKAGCDIILHCNGLLGEMNEIVDNISYTTDEFMKKVA